MIGAKPGEAVDEWGVPIYPGDLVRAPHFKERNGRRHYLYHVATWNPKLNSIEMVPTQELEPTLQGHGGRYWIGKGEVVRGRVIHGFGPGDCLDFDDRPKRKPAKEPAGN